LIKRNDGTDAPDPSNNGVVFDGAVSPGTSDGLANVIFEHAAAHTTLPCR
jgi:hypothetical protein